MFLSFIMLIYNEIVQKSLQLASSGLLVLFFRCWVCQIILRWVYRMASLMSGPDNPWTCTDNHTRPSHFQRRYRLIHFFKFYYFIYFFSHALNYLLYKYWPTNCGSVQMISSVGKAINWSFKFLKNIRHRFQKCWHISIFALHF